MSLRFTNDSVNYDLVDEKFLVNPVSGLYLRIHQAHKRVYESEPNTGDSDFMWFVNEDGQAANGEFTVSPVDEAEDVPVNRAAALIEEALNAKAAEEPAPVVEEPTPVVEEPAPVVEEEVPEVTSA